MPGGPLSVDQHFDVVSGFEGVRYFESGHGFVGHAGSLAAVTAGSRRLGGRF